MRDNRRSRLEISRFRGNPSVHLTTHHLQDDFQRTKSTIFHLLGSDIGSIEQVPEDSTALAHNDDEARDTRDPAMSSFGAFQRWLHLKHYQLELTFGVYMYTPWEKFAFCT